MVGAALVAAGALVPPDIMFCRAWAVEFVKNNTIRQARVDKVRFHMRTTLVLVDLFTTFSDAPEFLDIIIKNRILDINRFGRQRIGVVLS